MRSDFSGGSTWTARVHGTLQSPPPFWLIWLLTVALAIFYVSFAFFYGPILTADGERDIEYAILLSTVNFDLGAYKAQADVMGGEVHPTPKLFTLFYLVILATLDALLGEKWLEGLLIVNALAQTAVAAMVLFMASRISGNVLGLIVAAIFLFCSFDFYQWVAMSQSEPIFIAITTATLWLAAIASTEENLRSRILAWSGALAFLAVSTITRPSWPPVAATMAGAAIMASALRAGFGRRTITVYTRWLAVAFILALALIFASATVHFYPLLLPEGVLRSATMLWRDELSNGVVVIDRPETFISSKDSLAGFVLVMLVRLVVFFRFTADGFSFWHQLANIAGHIPLYGLALLGIARAFWSPESLSRFVGALALTWISYFFILVVFHSVQFLDFDWRYRAPAYPGFIVLACIGATTCSTWVGKFLRTHAVS